MHLSIWPLRLSFLFFSFLFFFFSKYFVLAVVAPSGLSEGDRVLLCPSSVGLIQTEEEAEERN